MQHARGTRSRTISHPSSQASDRGAHCGEVPRGVSNVWVRLVVWSGKTVSAGGELVVRKKNKKWAPRRQSCMNVCDITTTVLDVMYMGHAAS